MNDHTQLYITLPVAVFAIFLSVISLVLTVAIYKKPNINDAGQDVKSKYYETTSRTSAMGNLIASLSVSIYCIWVIFEPTHTVLWFIMFRGVPTLAWFISKASLIWFYNGLLYFTFRKGLMQTSRVSFIVANSVICTSAVVCVVCGYTGVYFGTQWLMFIGFEGFSFMYLCCSTYVCFGFVRKMLLLYVFEQECEIASYAQNSNKDVSRQSELADQTSFFLHVATKKTIFMTCISISSCFVAASRLIYEYALHTTDLHVALMLPMVMFSVDAIITSCCIYMFSKSGDPAYHKWCHLLNVCCKDVMHKVGRNHLNSLEKHVHASGDSRHNADSISPPTSVAIEVESTVSTGDAGGKGHGQSMRIWTEHPQKPSNPP